MFILKAMRSTIILKLRFSESSAFKNEKHGHVMNYPFVIQICQSRGLFMDRPSIKSCQRVHFYSSDTHRPLNLPSQNVMLFLVIGSFSNENGEKAIGLLSKTTTLHVLHAFLYTSLPSLHDNDVNMPNFCFMEDVN